MEIIIFFEGVGVGVGVGLGLGLGLGLGKLFYLIKLKIVLFKIFNLPDFSLCANLYLKLGKINKCSNQF